MRQLKFTDSLLERREPSGIDVDTTLDHFCILTFYIDVQAVRKLVHPRFELITVNRDGKEFALLSVVPFVDRDFRFVIIPWWKWKFNQTNFRIYVRDTENDENVVWFIGTSLNSWTVNIPRLRWKLPWHQANIRFDCEFDEQIQRYNRYSMETTNSWADASIDIRDTGNAPTELRGFDDLETGLVILTHPLTGYFYRRDGALGSYSIWHEQIEPTVGTIQSCRVNLLDESGLADSSDINNVHSVLLQPSVKFTIYLPPKIVE